jgi:precorrin-6A/cobalt-precorrin-6A reductase
MRILLLGGTTEASSLASRLGQDPRIDLTLSLVGLTQRLPVTTARVRTGGFGGTTGLVAYLQRAAVDVVLDATHPFAAVMPFHAAEACGSLGIPLLKVYRPGWQAVEGDRWVSVADLEGAAAALVARHARRVFLTTGRQELEPFRNLHVTFVVRSIEPPDLTGFESATALLMRGPFDVEGERAILRQHAIDTLVTKNSGGTAAAAKLQAARELGLQVIIVQRPPIPRVPLAETVAEALAWIDERVSRRGTSAE